MEPDTPAPSSRRPRPWLLVLLGVVIVAALIMKLGGSATPVPPASNPARPAQRQKDARLDPAALDVRLEALQKSGPGPGDTERNPFVFKPTPPPALPPRPPTGPGTGVSSTPAKVIVPSGPLPITIKFMGTVEASGLGQVASFTDCRSTFQVKEGQEFAGQYRLVKIGVESVVVEYIDGTGRTTLRMNAQECVAK